MLYHYSFEDHECKRTFDKYVERWTLLKNMSNSMEITSHGKFDYTHGPTTY